MFSQRDDPSLSSYVNKLILIKGFGKNISKLVLGSNKFKCNIPFLCIIYKEMMSNLYMLGPRVLHLVL